MSAEEHTAWTAVSNEVHDRPTYFDKDGARIGETANLIAKVQWPLDKSEQAKTARLFAAAPDLLEALKAVMDWWGNDTSGSDEMPPEIFDQAHAAISKAEEIEQ